MPGCWTLWPPPQKSATSSPLTMDEVERLSPFRRRLYRVAASRWLELFTMSLIILNTVLMCINWFEMPESVERATNYINYVFTVYFLVEMILKMTAFGLVRCDGVRVLPLVARLARLEFCTYKL